MSGFIAIPIILVYVLVSLLISFILYKVTEKKILSSVVLVMILTFPFWDLIAQKTIKTFYQATGLLEPKIYAYPEKDENGMVDSLYLKNGLYSWLINTQLDKFDNRVENKYGTILKERIKYLDFILPFKGKNKIFRFYLKNKKIEHIVLEEAHAKYKIIVINRKNYLGIYGTAEWRVIDISSDQIIAKINSFSTYSNKLDEFRTQILRFPNIHVSGIDGYRKLVKKVFNIKKIY